MMQLHNTTPVPNTLFQQLPKLTGTELKALLWIIRSTLGWKDQRTGKRKQRDWISNSQFVKQAGISERSVSTAIESLVQKGMIRATDERNQDLSSPTDRKFATRIYYSLSLQLTAKITDPTAKNDQKPKQKLPSTKETFTKRYSANERIPDHVRMQEILQEQERKQQERDNWNR